MLLSFRLLLASSICASAIALASAAEAETAPATLYERIESRLRNDSVLAARVGQPPPELEQLRWMIGTWNVTARVFATTSSPESISHGTSIVMPALNGTWLCVTDTFPSGQDVGYIGYEYSTHRWVALSLDSSPGAHLTYADGAWHGNRLIFRGPPTQIVGEVAVLRQTLEKRSEREYRVLNEEELSSGHWVTVDEYVYRKK